MVADRPEAQQHGDDDAGLNPVAREREERDHSSGTLLEVVLSTLGASLLIRALLGGPAWAAWLAPTVWINLPLFVLLLRRLRLASHGFSFRQWTRGTSWMLGSVALLVISFTLGSAALSWLGWGAPRDWLPPVTAAAVHPLLFQAVPEELFFRGYVQTRLRAWAGPRSAIVLTALLFTLAHLVVAPSWVRAGVLLPGLVMSWLRERSGGLLAPTSFHWISNLLVASL